MSPRTHARDADPGAVLAPTAAAQAPRPRPFVVPPPALVPPPPDPADHEHRIDAAILALERVRDQLERTRHSLDVFVSQITRIPAPAHGAHSVAAAAPAPSAPVLPAAPLDTTTGTPVALSGFVLGHAAPSAAPGAPAAPAAPVAPEPAAVPLTHRVAGRRVSPRASAAAQAGPAADAATVTYAAPPTYGPRTSHVGPGASPAPPTPSGAVPAPAGPPAALRGPQDPAPHGVPARRLGRPVGPRRATTPPETGPVRPPVALSEHLRPAAPAPGQRSDGA